MIVAAVVAAYFVAMIPVLALCRAASLGDAACPVCHSDDVIFDTDHVGLCLTCKAAYSPGGWQ